MARLKFITKQDLEQFKLELFAELRRPSFKRPRVKNLKCPWIQSAEVQKLLKASPNTLKHWNKSSKLEFEKKVGLICRKYKEIEALVEGKNLKSK